MSRFMSSRFAALASYVPGEQPQDMQYVKLNTNESPFPPSPEVIAAVSVGEVEKLNLYPDPECRRLRGKLAALYGVEPEQVFLANGSDEILNFFFMAFCDAERGVAFPGISYGFYPVYAQLYNLPAAVIPLLAGPRQLYNRNLLYTAVTRARKCVTIVGSEAVFQGMIDNDREQDRNTSLCDRIRELCQDSTDEL